MVLVFVSFDTRISNRGRCVIFRRIDKLSSFIVVIARRCDVFVIGVDFVM